MVVREVVHAVGYLRCSCHSMFIKQLDDLSKEELVRRIKKQALMLQKVKAHSDGQD